MKEIISYISHEVEEKRTSARVEKEANDAEASSTQEKEGKRKEPTEHNHTFSEIMINAANSFAHEVGVLSPDVAEHQQFSEMSDNINTTEHHSY